MPVVREATPIIEKKSLISSEKNPVELNNSNKKNMLRVLGYSGAWFAYSVDRSLEKCSVRMIMFLIRITYRLFLFRKYFCLLNIIKNDVPVDYEKIIIFKVIVNVVFRKSNILYQ